MNYIAKLQEENKSLQAENKALRDGIADLIGYLSLPKFREDTTVQVSDVFLRLREAVSAANSAGE